MKTKFLTVILSVSLICLFSGCGNKEEKNPVEESSEVLSTEITPEISLEESFSMEESTLGSEEEVLETMEETEEISQEDESYSFYQNLTKAFKKTFEKDSFQMSCLYLDSHKTMILSEDFLKAKDVFLIKINNEFTSFEIGGSLEKDKENFYFTKTDNKDSRKEMTTFDDPLEKITLHDLMKEMVFKKTIFSEEDAERFQIIQYGSLYEIYENDSKEKKPCMTITTENGLIQKIQIYPSKENDSVPEDTEIIIITVQFDATEISFEDNEYKGVNPEDIKQRMKQEIASILNPKKE